MADQMKAPTEPEPKDWLTQEKVDDANKKFKSSKSILKNAGLLEKALIYWVQTKISKDVEIENEKEVIDVLINRWREANPNREIDSDELRNNLRIKPACLEWCKQQWGHTIDTIYLKQKNSLSRASCRLIRMTDKDLANEIYFRVKNMEVSFEQAALEYGEGPERNQGGLIPVRKLEEMPLGLAPLLERLKVDELSPPLKLGKGFCIVKLIKFIPSSLNDETSNQIYSRLLRLWIDDVVELVGSRII